MNYEVFLSEPAEAEAQKAFLWLVRFSPDFAGEWYDGFLQAIASLSTFPGRCPLAPENDDFPDRDVHQHLYQKGKTAYRILFDILGEDVVRVMHVRHAAQSAGSRDRNDDT